MHMHFQYIKCWLDKGFNILDKMNKKSRYLIMINNWDLNLSITSSNKIYGSRSENM